MVSKNSRITGKIGRTDKVNADPAVHKNKLMQSAGRVKTAHKIKNG